MKLCYVSQETFEPIKVWEPIARAQAFAALNRINALYMIQRAGSGHIGSSFSAMDIMTWILLEYPDDVFISSKGHDCPALYATLISLGKLSWGMLHQLRREGGLPGHPTVQAGFPASTGSLGMGISKAKGIAWAKQYHREPGRVFVLVGDGELQEGQIWESLNFLGRDERIIIIVDGNRMQSDSFLIMAPYIDLDPGWTYFDGHDFYTLDRLLNSKYCLLWAHTTKGKGVSFLERVEADGYYPYHSGSLSEGEYSLALNELVETARRVIHPNELGFDTVEVEAPKKKRSTLIEAYGTALCEIAAKDERILVLDADLETDHCLTEFRRRYPRRFIECGIAEQDMVSMAGALARQGFIPFVHSFAAFLVRRAYDQIYNNCCEGDKVIYVGSLAGPLGPTGPGESHEIMNDKEILRMARSGHQMGIVEPTVETIAGDIRAAVRDEKPMYLRLRADR